jgi:hypothetical protein
MYNLHQHIKNDIDSTDVVENDYMYVDSNNFDTFKVSSVVEKLTKSTTCVQYF